MPNHLLLDANIIVRLAVADHPEHFEKAQQLFSRIERGQIQAYLMDMIIAEIIYVLFKVYGYSRSDVARTVRLVLKYEHITVDNPALVYRALELFESARIDFADAMLCARKQLEGYEVASFDKKVLGC